MTYGDWATLPPALVEQIARTRLIEQARGQLGITPNLPEQGVVDAAMAETILGGPGIARVVDPQDLKAKFATPGLDTIVAVLSRGGANIYNESGIWNTLIDSPIGHVTPASARHKAWGSTFGDGVQRVLTRAEIAAHPEWMGKYFSTEDVVGFVDGTGLGGHAAFANVRDDVLWCESFYLSLANQGVKARGRITGKVQVSAGVYRFTVALDNGLSGTPGIDASAGLVSTLPLSGAGGLYNQGVVGAMFMPVDGLYPFRPHMVDSNTANTITLAEVFPGLWFAGNNYIEGITVTQGTTSYVCVAKHTSSLGVNDPATDVAHAFWRTLVDNALMMPAIGDHFELIQFHGGGPLPSGLPVTQFTRRIEIGALALKLTRAVGIQFSSPQVIGCGQFATQVTQTTPDTPIIAANDMAYYHFQGWAFAHSQPNSTRALIEADGTGFATQAGGANGGAALSNQQGYFEKMFLGGFFSGTYTARLGTFAAPIAIQGPNPNGTGTLGGATFLQFVVPIGVTLAKNQLRGAWIVIKGAADGRNAGKRYLIAAHEAANAGDKCALGLWFAMPGFAPSIGDTFYVETGCAAGVEFGAGAVQVQGSSGPQGSENTFLECFAGGFSSYAVASLTGNALQHTWIGGNMAANPCYGIFAYWGNWYVAGCGFQSGTDRLYNQVTHARSDPSKYGFDMIFINTSLEATVIEGCRSESPRFLCNAGNPRGQYVRVTGCECYGQFKFGAGTDDFGVTKLDQWGGNQPISALPTAGGIYLPTMTIGGNLAHRDGNIYVAQSINGGAKTLTTTGSETEPAWDQIGGGFGSRTTTENVVGGPGAGDSIAWYGIDDWMLWLQNFLSNGHFNVIEGINVSVDDFSWNFGKMCPVGKKIGHIFVSRKDWISSSSPDWSNQGDSGAMYRWEIQGPVECNPPNANSDVNAASWGFPAHSGGAPFTAYPFAKRLGGVHPILWVFGDQGGNAFWEGGWGPGARTVPVLSPFGRRWDHTLYDYSHAVIAPQSPVVMSPSLDYSSGNANANNVGSTGITDKNGQNLRFSGGFPTGLGAPGHAQLCYPDMTGAVSGTAEPPAGFAVAHEVDDKGRFVSSRGTAVATGVVTNVANAGSYTPDAAAKRTHRLNAQGATLTVANPTNLVDGSQVALDIKNGSGAASACTLGTKYLGTFPMGANTKRRTQLYEYDAAADLLVPIGAQSGDL